MRQWRLAATLLRVCCSLNSHNSWSIRTNMCFNSRNLFASIKLQPHASEGAYSLPPFLCVVIQESAQCRALRCQFLPLQFTSPESGNFARDNVQVLSKLLLSCFHLVWTHSVSTAVEGSLCSSPTLAYMLSSFQGESEAFLPETELLLGADNCEDSQDLSTITSENNARLNFRPWRRRLTSTNYMTLYAPRWNSSSGSAV